MDLGFIQKLYYSSDRGKDRQSLPSILNESLQHCVNSTKGNSNKFCIIFPSKEYAAQWLSVSLAFINVKSDYDLYTEEIFNSYKKFKSGDKLILNNEAIVQWVRGDENGIVFRTKSEGKSSGTEIKVKHRNIFKLQPAPSSRKVLSAFKRVKEAFTNNKQYPIDQLLDIETAGNRLFQKHSISLVTKVKHFEDSLDNVLINQNSIQDYLKTGRIEENGSVVDQSPLLVSSNLTNLVLYLTNPRSISHIVIDGYSHINERGTDFADIDVLKIPTILITDLSEIESFNDISRHGFVFFSPSNEDAGVSNSIFRTFESKLAKSKQFKLHREICQDEVLQELIHKIHQIRDDKSNDDLTTLRISLIQFTNLASRVISVLQAEEIGEFNAKIGSIETLFLKSKAWLAESRRLIEETIPLMKSLIIKFSHEKSAKCGTIERLLQSNSYDYVICCTATEVESFLEYLKFLPVKNKPRVISISDINDELLSNRPVKAILTGWPKCSNVNRILASFLFSDLTLLFYKFEDAYYASVQRRVRNNLEAIKISADKNQNSGLNLLTRYEHVYSLNEHQEIMSHDIFDIHEFEIKVDEAQYAKYSGKDNLLESVNARRVDFENDSFIYSSEPHKFLVINELIYKADAKTTIHRKKVDSLRPGNLIAFINTDRDILVDLVEKNTNKKELASVKQWTELWKNLLKEYYFKLGNDFKQLVEDLRKNDCKKHEVTIRTWLQDEGRIGPEDDSDLISIALLTESNLLNDNISTVRSAIRKMTGWRMQASDYIIDKIKSKITESADASLINKRISIDGLGNLSILKVKEISGSWDTIDSRYVNRLLQKESE